MCTSESRARSTGVSPVVGVILMVAVTVLLSGVVFHFTTSIGQQTDNPSITDAGYTGEIDETQTIRVQGVTGNPPTDRLAVVVRTESKMARISPDGSVTGDLAISSISGALLSSDTWGAGDTTTFTIAEELPAGETVDVTIIDTAKQDTVSTKTLQTRGMSFSSWKNSTVVEVSNPNSQTLTNYQVLVDVPHKPGMAQDFSDIRFTWTDADGNTHRLSYWIETQTAGSSAKVWVEAPNLTANATTNLTLLYNNSGASSASTIAGTFMANKIYYENRDCTSGTYCGYTDNHSEFDTAMTYSLYGTTYIDQIEYHDNHPLRDGEYFSTRYRFLFVPDESGTYTFRTDSDDASELLYNPTDTDQHNVVTSWYGGHGDRSGQCGGSHDGSKSLSAGQGYWMEYRQEEWGGGADSELCIQSPSSSTMTILNSTNFEGQFFTRKYAPQEPTTTVR